MTPTMNSTGHSYDATLAELATTRPRLAAALQQAQQQRAHHAASLLHGARFKGLDELLRHLDDLVQAFESEPTLSRLGFLVTRSAAEFETAIEATLSGYLAVATDAMRDVMEIENLFLDFAVHPSHIDAWLTATPTILWNKFRPAEVRKRLHAAKEGHYATTAESVDYRAHSAVLHVSPRQPLIASKGFSAQQGWQGDAGFWEIFEHARRLLHAIRRLTSTLSPGSTAERLAAEDLTDMQDAWRRTREMQSIYLALLQAAAQVQAERGEDS